jgi:hypothetical protein
MTQENAMNDTSRSGPSRRPVPSRSLMAGIALAVLGAAVGAGGMKIAQNRQPKSVVLLQPVSIDKLRSGSLSAVRGNVSDIFGNKFLVEDGSGRALVDLGPRGENGAAVTKGENITVQGIFERGVVHAQVVSHADGRNEAFGPAPPPPPGAPPPPRMAEVPPAPPGASAPAPRPDAPLPPAGDPSPPAPKAL